MFRRLSRNRLQSQEPVCRGTLGAREGAVGSRPRLSRRGYPSGLLQVYRNRLHTVMCLWQIVARQMDFQMKKGQRFQTMCLFQITLPS